jgi:hypothetical protein
MHLRAHNRVKMACYRAGHKLQLAARHLAAEICPSILPSPSVHKHNRTKTAAKPEQFIPCKANQGADKHGGDHT